MKYMQSQQKGSSIGPAVAGIVIGAAVTAGTVILSDKRKRKQVVDKMNTIKGKTSEILEHARIKVRDLHDNTENILDDTEEMLDHPDSTIIGKKH